MDEAQVSFYEHPNILNLGILKSYNKQGIGDQTETEKDHYFLHLSFQEYFAARYLFNALQGSQNEKAVQFIKHHKYNQRCISVLTFAAGLLSESKAIPAIEIFWDTLLGEPLDLVGIQHMQLIISCIEETSNKSTFLQRSKLLAYIEYFIKHNSSFTMHVISNSLALSLRRAQSLVSQAELTNIFINMLQSNDIEAKVTTLSFISQLNIRNPSTELLIIVTSTLDDINERVKPNACKALGNMGARSATDKVISKLVRALDNESEYVRTNACSALGKMGEKGATDEVISKIVNALGDESWQVRSNACETLGQLGEKAATDEVISKLFDALRDKSEDVKRNAREALTRMIEKATTNKVISKFVSALGDDDKWLQENVCLIFGHLGEKAATNEVISMLVSALDDNNEHMKANACYILGHMGAKVLTNEVISKLVSALGDESEDL